MKYHKINSVYKREEDTGKFIFNDYAKPEFLMLKDIPWNWTEKIDGTNIRIYWNFETGKVEFKGRTDKAQIQPHLLEFLEKTFQPYMFEQWETDIVIYGEGMGSKINKGERYFPGEPKKVSICLFDVKINKWFLKHGDVQAIADKFGVYCVGQYEPRTLSVIVDKFKRGEKLRSFFNPEIEPEGVVGRCMYELFDRAHERIIVKLKFKDFR